IREEGGDPAPEEVPLSKQFERGWFWGSEAFRERLAGRIENLGKRKSRNYRSRSAGPAKDHGLRRAEEIVAEGERHDRLDESGLKMDRRGDWRRASVAWAKETSAPHSWIAQRLNLKSAANASQQIRRFALASERELPKEV